MNLSIKDWAVEDRPREKLMEKGALYLSDAELLAIIIGSGSAKESALDLAKKIIQHFKGINHLALAEIEDLLKISGIGPAKAVGILSSFELGKRAKFSPSSLKKIQSSKDAFDILYPILGSLKHEEFWVLILNRANVPIKKINISKGGVAGTVVDIKIIAKEIIKNLACGIIIAHNHPSGNLNPSAEDLSITKKIKNSMELIDCNLLDHLIISNHSYYSFSDEGMM